MRMQGYCDVYKWTVLKRTSPEVKCLHLTSSRREMCMSSISNVIYHIFSHGAAFFMLSGKNVNVMLEFTIRINMVMAHVFLVKVTFQVPDMNVAAEFADSASPDEVAHNEPPHLDLNCVSSSL